MLDDMRMRKLAPKTQTHYLRAVRGFAQFLGRSPDTATVEDLRRYQLHLVDAGTSPISLKSNKGARHEWHLLKLFRVPVAQHICSGEWAWFHQ
jgi:hypothetical protein